MRALATDLAHVLFTLPFWVLAALAWLAVAAWRAPAGTRLAAWRWRSIVLAAGFYALSTPIPATWIGAWIESRHPPVRAVAAQRGDGNVIVVLTAGWLRATEDGHEQKIGEAGWERTRAGVALWREVGGRLVFSGAPAPDGRGSAAEAMAEVARQMGVPAGAIRVEGASRTTRENLLYTRGLLGPNPPRTWLVTSALHMPRSVAAARAVGLEVIPYPCDYRTDRRLEWTQLLPSNGAWSALEGALHEVAGILVYRLRGWA